jgi:hypothetical protein
MSIEGKEEELATGVKAHLNEWDKDFKKAKDFPDSRRINQRLNQTRSRQTWIGILHCYS